MSMRTVKSLSEATRLAAQSGASLEVGGRVINASGTRMAVARPTPAPMPEPEPPKADPFERLADSLTNVLQLHARLSAHQSLAVAEALAVVAERLQAPAEAAKPSTKRMPIEFSVVRDGAGRALALTPTYGEVSGRLLSFDPVRGPDGLIERIVTTYT